MRPSAGGRHRLRRLPERSTLQGNGYDCWSPRAPAGFAEHSTRGRREENPAAAVPTPELQHTRPEAPVGRACRSLPSNELSPALSRVCHQLRRLPRTAVPDLLLRVRPGLTWTPEDGLYNLCHVGPSARSGSCGQSPTEPQPQGLHQSRSGPIPGQQSRQSPHDCHTLRSERGFCCTTSRRRIYWCRTRRRSWASSRDTRNGAWPGQTPARHPS